MKHKAHFIIILCLTVLGLTAGGSSAATPLGSGFTYQGELQDGSGPVNGSCDFKFSLWDTAESGNQIGQEQTVGAVAVADGRFTVLLNGSGQFGANPFKGQARWLQIRVRCPAGSGTYTKLQPRQRLSATPYAAYSQNSPWSGLTGVPAGFADGVDNVGSGGNDHNHLGQTWKGKDNPLRIEGYYRNGKAPLILSNSAGNGLVVGLATLDGVSVESVAGDGVHVGWAVDDGVYVKAAGDDGVYVGEARDDGVSVGEAWDDGVYVNSAGDDGVYVESAGDDGVYVGSAVDDGVYVESAGDDGVYVQSAVDDGVYVESAGSLGVYVRSAGDDGVYVESAGDEGFLVDWALGRGFAVGSTGSYGVYVGSAGSDGVYVAEATNYAGVFGGDIYVSGSCTGCVLAEFGVNSGAAALEPGDIVTVQGTMANELAGQPLLMQVSAAASGQTAIGVVQGRAELQEVQEEEQLEENGESGETAHRLVPRDGAAKPGEYVTIAIYGPVQVKADQLGSHITVGSRLVVDENGRARALQTTEVNGIQVAESAPTIGIALDQPAADGLVWVLVNPQ